MRFLVLGENLDPGYLLPPDQIAGAVEGAVIPSFRQLGNLEREGRVRGGIFTGERAGAFLIEAESAAELNQTLGTLPFAGLVKWQVKAMIDFDTAADQAAEAMQQLKAMAQGGGQPSASGQ